MRAIGMIFSLFTRIPVPHFSWEEKSSRWAVCFLPLVGIVIGGMEGVLLVLAKQVLLSPEVSGILFVALPIFLTGGIHLDGLIDTADARHSYGENKEKQRILKDPHVGAFGIIRLALYLLVVLAIIITVLENEGEAGKAPFLLQAGYAFVLSRGMVSVSVIFFPPMKEGGMLGMLREHANATVRMVVAGELLLIIAGVWLLFPIPVALCMTVAEGVLFIGYYRFAVQSFGGISGDLSGWFLCMVELVYGVGMLVCSLW